MEFKYKIYALLKKFDLFPTNQFLRYQKQKQYSTAFGGCVSLIIIILMIALFINVGLQTINKSLISSAMTYSIESDPPSTSFKINGFSEFMFGFTMLGVNVSDPLRKIFDFTLTYNFYGPYLTKINSTQIQLVKCTQQHFRFNSETIQAFKLGNPQFHLCPKIGAQFTLGGSSISSIYTRLQLSIVRCNSSLDINCINDSQAMTIQQSLGGQFIYAVFSVNSIVNPNDETYKGYYVDDKNYDYLFLNSTTVAQLTVLLEENTINTDISLLPFQINLQQKSLATSQKAILRNKPRTNNLYGQMIIEKSKKTITYTRSFNKLDNLFSYIGGFVGVILLIFFALNSYSEAAYTHSIAQDLFDNSNEQTEKSFNFLYYFLIKIKGFLQFFKYSKPWKDTDYFNTHIEEAQEQLDISLILKRLFYLQEAFSILLKPQQIEALYLFKKIRRKAAKERRLKYNFLDKINPKRIQHNKNKISQQFQAQHNSEIIIDVQNQESLSQKLQRENQSINTQFLRQKLKTKIIRVIQESRKGDERIKSIVSKINPIVFKQFDLNPNDPIVQIQFKQAKKNNLQFQEEQASKNDIKQQ